MSGYELSNEECNQILFEVCTWLQHTYDIIRINEEKCFVEIIFPIPETQDLHIFINVLDEMRLDLDAIYMEMPTGNLSKLDEWKKRFKNRKRFYFSKDDEYVMLEYPYQLNIIKKPSDQTRLISAIGELVLTQKYYFLEDLQDAKNKGLIFKNS